MFYLSCMFSRNKSEPLWTDSSSAVLSWWETCCFPKAPPNGQTSDCPVFWLTTPCHSPRRDTIWADYLRYLLFGLNMSFNWKFPAIRNLKYINLSLHCKKKSIFFKTINNKVVFLHDRTVILTVYMDTKQTGPKPVFTCMEDAPHNYPSVFSGCSFNHIDCSIQGSSNFTCFVSPIHETSFIIKVPDSLVYKHARVVIFLDEQYEAR